MQQQITHAHYARSSIFYQGTPAQCRLGGAMHLHFCRRQKSPFRRRLLYTVSSSSCWPISLSLSLPVQELVWVNIRRCFQRNSDRRLPAPWLAARGSSSNRLRSPRFRGKEMPALSCIVLYTIDTCTGQDDGLVFGFICPVRPVVCI